MLSEVFCFHPLAIKDCMERNHVPKVHVYPGYVFLVLHAPVGGKAGHVHYIELDQFVGHELPGHGARPAEPRGRPGGGQGRGDVPAAPAAGGQAATRRQPYELSHGMVSALTGRLRNYTAVLTQDVWKLEQRVTAGHLG